MKQILFTIILTFNLLPYFEQGKLNIATIQVNAQSYGSEADLSDCGSTIPIFEGDCTVTYRVDCYDFIKVYTEISRTCTVLDCSGEPNGSAYIDGCGVCVGGTTGLNACIEDCNNELGGTAYYDACGVCVDGSTGLSACTQDCNGEWGGTAFQDPCGVCVDGSTGLTACAQDCNGEWGGTAFQDACGICVGGSTGSLECMVDCNNDPGGSAYYDDCGICVDGLTGNRPCDCNGESGGSAYYNECGICVGGGSPNLDECPNTNSTEDPKSYYFKIEGDDTKYYSSSTITLKEQTDDKIITLYDESGAAINGSQFTWKRYKKLFGSELLIPSPQTGDHISLVLNTQGNIKIKVSKTGISDLVLNISIYSSDAIIFSRGNNYEGLFGFDDVGWQFPAISANYDNDFALNGIDYHVPWLGLNKENSSNAKALVSIKNSIIHSSFNYIDIKTEPLNSNISFKRASNAGAATATLRLTKSELQTMIANDEKLVIESSAPLTAANPIDYFRANVIVKNNSGDKIGALNVSCQNPVEKKIIIVYVKTTASGSYRDNELPEQAILDYLNNNSHNQLFRKWVLEKKDAAGNNYPKYMDVSSLYASNSNFCRDINTTPTHLSAAYQLQFNFISPTGSDDVKVRMLYITDLTFALMKGNSIYSNYLDAMITTLGKNQTIAHECAHLGNLPHIFPDNRGTNYNISQNTTQNFMDYNSLPDNRNMFYFYQWLKTN